MPSGRILSLPCILMAGEGSINGKNFLSSFLSFAASRKKEKSKARKFLRTFTYNSDFIQEKYELLRESKEKRFKKTIIWISNRNNCNNVSAKMFKTIKLAETLQLT